MYTANIIEDNVRSDKIESYLYSKSWCELHHLQVNIQT